MIATYDSVRSRVAVGDVIAFAGSSPISRLIQAVTRCPVSHVALVSHLDAGDECRVVLLEVTSLAGDPRVQLTALSQHVESYDGAVYWLPLAPDVRVRVDADALKVWGLSQLGRPYDYAQAAGSALDDLPFVPDIKEDFTRWFCSELVAHGLEVARAITPINASTQTPRDVVSLGIYAQAVQIRGEPRPLVV